MATKVGLQFPSEGLRLDALRRFSARGQNPFREGVAMIDPARLLVPADLVETFKVFGGSEIETP